MMDKATEMQISVEFLDLDIFTFINISQDFVLVVKAIGNAVNNDYMVGVYYTGH
jgi:hypothetical protein